jgi:hypothetical protein
MIISIVLLLSCYIFLFLDDIMLEYRNIETKYKFTFIY